MTILEFEIDDHNAGYKCVAPLIKKICEDHENRDLHIKIKINGIADYSENNKINTDSALEKIEGKLLTPKLAAELVQELSSSTSAPE